LALIEELLKLVTSSPVPLQLFHPTGEWLKFISHAFKPANLLPDARARFLNLSWHDSDAAVRRTALRGPRVSDSQRVVEPDGMDEQEPVCLRHYLNFRNFPQLRQLLTRFKFVFAAYSR